MLVYSLCLPHNQLVNIFMLQLNANKLTLRNVLHCFQSLNNLLKAVFTYQDWEKLRFTLKNVFYKIS